MRSPTPWSGSSEIVADLEALARVDATSIRLTATHFVAGAEAGKVIPLFGARDEQRDDAAALSEYLASL